MVTYGELPGVKITTESGPIGDVALGREQFLILVGVGDNAAGSAAVNEPVTIDGRDDVDNKFGADTDISDAYRTAVANGANTDFIQGVMAKTTGSTESFTSTSSGTVTNTPLVADTDRLDVSVSGSSQDINFVYDSSTSPPSSSGTAHVNPLTGKVELSSSVSFEVTYEYADWTTAIEAVPDALVRREFGILHPLTNHSGIVSTIQSVVTQMRDNLKLVLPVLNVEPNATTSNFRPKIDPANYTQQNNDDTLFKVAPTALSGSTTGDPNYGFGASPAVAGLMAGTATNSAIYDTTLTGVDLAQQLSPADVTDLSDQYVIPIRDIDVPTLERSHSTYDQATNGGWTRDYFRRQIVDLAVATIHAVANRTIGSVLRPDTVADTQEAIQLELEQLEADGLLEPGGQELRVQEKSSNTIGIEAQITPFGVVKSADATLQINI